MQFSNHYIPPFTPLLYSEHWADFTSESFTLQTFFPPLTALYGLYSHSAATDQLYIVQWSVTESVIAGYFLYRL